MSPKPHSQGQGGVPAEPPSMPYLIGPARLARFFYHDCERYLRFEATPSRQRPGQGIPPKDKDYSPVTRSLLEAGFEWEERVLAMLGPQALVPPGSGRLRERSWPAHETVERLGRLVPGQYLYQGSLAVPASFYARYGLDSQLLHFPDCKPDLLLRTEQGSLRVVDVKATDELKSSHRIQVALYALILREHLGDQVEFEEGGIWLSQQTEPTWFELHNTLPVLETFLRDKLAAVFQTPLPEVPWHLHYRCEWCDYFPHCRAEAEETGSVSLLPYLSHGGRSFLRQEGVDTLSQFRKYLCASPERLEGCGSMRGRSLRLKNQTQALLDQKIAQHGGSSLALPIHEHVRVMLTLEKEPVSGRIYAAGFYLLQGKDEPREVWVRCARSQTDTEALEHDFVLALHLHLSRLDAFNRGREWKLQRTLQTYVFDSLERDLFQDLLLRALDRAELAEPALQMLFHFQSEELAAQDDHPDFEVPFAVVALTEVIRELMALPYPLVVKLDDALKALRTFGFEYETPKFLSFQLSNALRQDAVLRTWSGQSDHVEWIEQTLKQRMISTSVVVHGLRGRVKERLFAWPPRFKFSDSQAYVQAELSRLAFVLRYECLLGALAQRAARAGPEVERLATGVSIPLQYQGGDRWKALSKVDSTTLSINTMHNRLLVPEGLVGELAQMAYDDFRQRTSFFSPSKSCVRIARVVEVTENPDDGTLNSIRLEVKKAAEQCPFEVGARAVLHSRFLDFTTDKMLGNLRALDAQTESDFVRLLRGKFENTAPVPTLAQPWSSATLAALTPSQQAALAHLQRHRLTVVWGPPGTGKTHFLAHALAALLQQGPLRIAVTAFTHAAVNNLLRKLAPLLAQAPLWRLNRQPEQAHEVDPAQAARLRGEMILAGTVYQLHAARLKNMPAVDVLVIDEGSQLKLGETALALEALAAAGRLLVAGDHRQLPPIIQGHYPETEDGRAGLQDSVFEYVQDRYPVCQLTENWRMNDCLSRFPASTLYGSDYRPARADIACQRLDLPQPTSADPLCQWLLDPDFPIALCILENVRATVENLVEAELVARLAVDLRQRGSWPDDDSFWTQGLFIVSPHHLQIRAIRRALSEKRAWTHAPFVDTVDKMQGQESQVVLVSYGVSDQETALGEAAFLYSLNRLNVSITRARAKCVVCLPRPLLEPGFDVLANPEAARGLGFMHALLEFCRQGEELKVELGGGVEATLYRRASG